MWAWALWALPLLCPGGLAGRWAVRRLGWAAWVIAFSGQESPIESREALGPGHRRGSRAFVGPAEGVGAVCTWMYVDACADVVRWSVIFPKRPSESLPTAPMRRKCQTSQLTNQPRVRLLFSSKRSMLACSPHTEVLCVCVCVCFSSASQAREHFLHLLLQEEFYLHLEPRERGQSHVVQGQEDSVSAGLCAGGKGGGRLRTSVFSVTASEWPLGHSAG